MSTSPLLAQDTTVRNGDLGSGSRPRQQAPPISISTWPDTGSGGKVHSIWRHIGRLLDVVIASVTLIIFAPLFIVITALVRATSPGPALFRQARIGYLTDPFVMFKFRTMYDNSDDAIHREYVTRMLTGENGVVGGPGGLFKLDGDPRITRIGNFLRRSSLDELPQLFNVLRGEMSLVGPRPALPWEIESYKGYHYVRFQVKPGMTGLWQVCGRSKLTMNTALDIDVKYVLSWSLGLDLWILAMTIPALLRGGAR
jgi:lipopolysaccharide/colanic/teichoic acid biosynthesis glycosyltransferase